MSISKKGDVIISIIQNTLLRNNHFILEENKTLA